MANPSMEVSYSSDVSRYQFSLRQVPCTKIYKTVLCSRWVAKPIIPPTFAKTVPRRTHSTVSCLANLWREVQGINNWQNLVGPLHPLLQQEIIRYGEFVGACYKAFDLDPTSRRYLKCKYGKRNIFREVGLGDCGYEVSKYIYATPDVNISHMNIPNQNDNQYCGRWIGFVAVSSDKDFIKRIGRRDVLITFRGTVTTPEWISNLMSFLTRAGLDPRDPRPEVKVEAGFLSLYSSNESCIRFGLKSCREQLVSEISCILNKYKGEDLSITLAGHSMGSSLALLFAYDVAELGLNRYDDQCQIIPLTVFSFGGPRVGNFGFKERCEELGVKVLRIVNVNDPITKLPGIFFNENFRFLFGQYEFPWRCSSYAHVGIELALDFFEMQAPSFVHDLETYISFLKCPRNAQIQREGKFLEIVRWLILIGQKFDRLQLQNNATNILNMLQSVRIDLELFINREGTSLD